MINVYIVCVVHAAIFGESVDISIGKGEKQNSTKLRTGDLGNGVWLLSAEEVTLFFLLLSLTGNQDCPDRS